MKNITAIATIDATPQRVWEVLSDFGGISTSAPHLKGSRLLTEGEPDVGAMRHCDFAMGGRTTEETVSRWVEGQGYSVDIKASGSPLPMKNASADFDISEKDGVTVLKGAMHYEMGMGPLGGLLEMISAKRFTPMWSDMLAGFKERAETGAEIDKDSELKIEAVTAS